MDSQNNISTECINSSLAEFNIQDAPSQNGTEDTSINIAETTEVDLSDIAEDDLRLWMHFLNSDLAPDNGRLEACSTND